MGTSTVAALALGVYLVCLLAVLLFNAGAHAADDDLDSDPGGMLEDDEPSASDPHGVRAYHFNFFV